MKMVAVNLFDSYRPRGVESPMLSGPYVEELAAPVTEWISEFIRPVTEAVVDLPRELIEAHPGLKPWELQNESLFQIGRMCSFHLEGQETYFYITPDPTTSNGTEAAVVQHYDQQFGYPTNCSLSILADVDHEKGHHDEKGKGPAIGRDLIPIFPETLKGRVRSIPERKKRLDLSAESERHLQAAINVANMTRTDRKNFKGAKKLSGRPDCQIGFSDPQATHEALALDAEGDTVMGEGATESRTADAPGNSDKERLLQEIKTSKKSFVPCFSLEEKAPGKLDLEALMKVYDTTNLKKKAEKANVKNYLILLGRQTRAVPASRSSAGQQRTSRFPRRAAQNWSNKVQDRFRDRTALQAPENPLSTGPMRIMYQLSAYALLTKARRAIVFDGQTLILNRFVDIRDGSQPSLVGDRLNVGKKVAYGLINVKETDLDVVLSAILGFAVEAFTDVLEQRGAPGTNIEELSEMVKTFQEENRDLYDTIREVNKAGVEKRKRDAEAKVAAERAAEEEAGEEAAVEAAEE